jgi:hypothetical protein
MDLGINLGFGTHRRRMERVGMVGRKLKMESHALIELQSNQTREIKHPCDETNIIDCRWHLGTVKSQMYLNVEQHVDA